MAPFHPRLGPPGLIGRALTLIVLLAALLAGARAARADEPSAPSDGLWRLLSRLPGLGTVIPMSELGITVGTVEGNAPRVEGGFNFRYPADLDRRSTTSPPYAGRFPGLHLNQSLRIRPRDVHYLFLSDQPEEIRDDRLREDTTRGATGLYARARIPGAAPTRVLVDHTNGTKRPLRFLLLWVPGADGQVAVRKRGQESLEDPVKAAMRCFLQVSGTPFEPNRPTRAGKPTALVDTVMVPRYTMVSQVEFNSTTPGQLFAIVTEADAAELPTLAAIDRLPVLHSIMWREEAERLKKFVPPATQPTRYRRILDAFQHARGLFPYPDRQADVSYDVASWKETAHPVRAYSYFESIPGLDVTTPARPHTDNRGRYGAISAMVFHLRRLPPGCREMVLLAINPDGTFGGRHYVTDRRTTAHETLLLPGRTPSMLANGKAIPLWRGRARPGMRLWMWMEPLANGSVYPWYVLVPVPGAR